MADTIIIPRTVFGWRIAFVERACRIKWVILEMLTNSDIPEYYMIYTFFNMSIEKKKEKREGMEGKEMILNESRHTIRADIFLQQLDVRSNFHYSFST